MQFFHRCQLVNVSITCSFYSPMWDVPVRTLGCPYFNWDTLDTQHLSNLRRWTLFRGKKSAKSCWVVSDPNYISRSPRGDPTNSLDTKSGEQACSVCLVRDAMQSAHLSKKIPSRIVLSNKISWEHFTRLRICRHSTRAK